MPAPIPPVIVEPFANAGLKDPIPLTTVDPARASYDLGFPPQTFEPIIAGGSAPFGQDVNGILFVLSSYCQYIQAGQLFTYDVTVATALGGYALGAVLISTDGETVWSNQVADNTTDPDAGGAGWVPLFSYGFTAFSTTGGVVTLTQDQYRRKVVVISGALAGNSQIVLPLTLQEWLIVNSTTGPHTLTVKTPAQIGGVVVPQGGFGAPIGVYGDGTNIYPTVSPLSVPIDVAATPSTLPERDGSADILARMFNSGIGLTNPTIGAVVVENNAADGYFRKISISDFVAQIGPLITTEAGLGSDVQTYTTLGRSAGVVYTNTTGRPIFVVISVGLTAGGSSCTATVGGLAVGGVVASGANTQFVLPFIVPPGITYRVDVTGGVLAFGWVELR